MTTSRPRSPIPWMFPAAFQRRTVHYSGRVQGVGFRYTTKRIAAGYAVTGYVRNLPDGRVEMVAEGPPAELDSFLRDIRDHFSSHIRQAADERFAANGEFDGFEIRF